MKLSILSWILSFVILLPNIGHVLSYRKPARKQIQGGELALPGEFTYTVAIQQKKHRLCTGGILDERHILTAAHCLIDTKTNKFDLLPLQIVAGTNYPNYEDIGTTIDVERVYVPSKYQPRKDGQEPVADIAVLRLAKSLDFTENPNLDKLQLPPSDFAEVSVAQVSGFGWSSVKTRYDRKLGKYVVYDAIVDGRMRHAEVKILSKKNCSVSFSLRLLSSQICAQMIQRNVKRPGGIGGGDSGAPLVHEGVVIGVTSGGPLGSREDIMPSVYTRVASYLYFIENARGDKLNFKKIRWANLPTMYKYCD